MVGAERRRPVFREEESKDGGQCPPYEIEYCDVQSLVGRALPTREEPTEYRTAPLQATAICKRSRLAAWRPLSGRVSFEVDPRARRLAVHERTSKGNDLMRFQALGLGLILTLERNVGDGFREPGSANARSLAGAKRGRVGLDWRRTGQDEGRWEDRHEPDQRDEADDHGLPARGVEEQWRRDPRLPRWRVSEPGLGS